MVLDSIGVKVIVHVRHVMIERGVMVIVHHVQRVQENLIMLHGQVIEVLRMNVVGSVMVDIV